MTALILAWMLTAAPNPPFPPPALVPVDEALKYAGGRVTSVDAAGQKAVVSTAAGLVTFQLKAARIVGPDRLARTFSDIAVGVQVRLYYYVGEGAKVKEVDLAPLDVS